MQSRLPSALAHGKDAILADSIDYLRDYALTKEFLRKSPHDQDLFLTSIELISKDQLKEHKHP